MPSFSPEQDAALKAVADWLKDKPGRGRVPLIFRLFGYAGTGKTTLAKHIAEGVDGKVLFAAFTGKAAMVMRTKGCQGASTIHSLIYRPIEFGAQTPSFELFDDAPASKAKLIVIDECSMVDAELGRDLKSFGVPLLVLGDPAQLPPIQGGGFFTDAPPDAMLTEVHRQAQDDPIIRLSMDIRAGNRLLPGHLRRDAGGDARRPRPAARARRRPGAGRPQRHPPRLQHAPARSGAASRASCRSPATSWSACATTGARACSTAGSGLIKERPRPRRQILTMHLKPDDGAGDRVVKVSVRPECFTGAIEELPWQQRKKYDEFDFGYVLTVHKAQGSQWDDVVLFDESFAFPDSRDRWLYTGVTRAAKRLTVVV